LAVAHASLERAVSVSVVQRLGAIRAPKRTLWTGRHRLVPAAGGIEAQLMSRKAA